MPTAVPGPAGWREAAVGLVAGARTRVGIRSVSLQASLYDDTELSEAMRRFLLSSPRAQLQILILDPERCLREGGRLLILAERLGSRVQFRQPDPAELVPGEEGIEQLLADDEQLLQRLNADSIEGQLHQDASPVRRAARDFARLWERSPPASALRRLNL